MKAYGETDFDRGIIRINKKKAQKSRKRGVRGELIDTIVHEELHVMHPNKGERKIIKLTKKALKNMSDKTKQKFYSLYK